MASMYGDPLEEARYNEQKKSMMRVTQANPPNESRLIPTTGAEIANDTIFRHCSDVGMSKNSLEAMIPSTGKKLIGELYGTPFHIDHTGRFQFGKESVKLGEVELFEYTEKETVAEVTAVPEPECDHGFVVRDVVGDDRFLCKECNVRFPRHPSMMPKHVISVHTSSVNIENALTQFREGIATFTQAIQATSLSLEEFTKRMKDMFPPEPIYDRQLTIGGGQVGYVQIDEEPKRTSCFKEVEDVFGNPHVTVDQVNQFRDGPDVFPDVVEVSHTMDETYGAMIVEVGFVDGSTQRVEIPSSQLMMRHSTMKPKSQAHADFLNGPYRRG